MKTTITKTVQYPAIDKRIKDTYSKDSRAQLNTKLYDPFVRAFSWASERIGDTGIVVFVTNNSFIDDCMFDGMRKHLAEEFNALYLLNLGGNMRKGQGNSNVFGITVGVSIAMLVRTGQPIDSPCIFYNNETELLNKAQTFHFLKTRENVGNVTWQKLKPNATKHVWLTEGLHADFYDLIPMGTKEAKKEKGVANGVIFKNFSLGVSTNRDAWVYNFNQDVLHDNVQHTIETYIVEMDRWKRQVAEWKRGNGREPKIDDFVLSDATKIKWSRDLKEKKLQKGKTTEYANQKVRTSLYRPFTKTNLFLDKILIDSPGQFPIIFPTPQSEMENRVICVGGYGRKEFAVLMSDLIPNLNLYGDPQQSFPFYIYNKDSKIRRENITDWALEAFKTYYGDDNISKWDIFYYIYGILYHPDYRDKYREDLKCSLPRISFAEDFWGFAKAGKQLADLHINYDSVPQYDKLTLKETPNRPLDWRVEKMKLSKDKTRIEYNDFLTIEDIPIKTYDYKLGKRSALEWMIDQYKIKEDKDTKKHKGSYIVNDPNRETEPRYIVDLIGRVTTVSLETVKIINNLPALYSVDGD